MTNDTLDRIDGAKHADTVMQEPLNEKNEHEHLSEPVDKQYLNNGGLITRYRHTVWFRPLIALAAGILAIIILSLIL